MNELKKLLVCALGVTVIFGFGCDVEEDCNEMGVCADSGAGEGGAGGEGGGGVGGEGGAGGGGGDITYDTVRIFDVGSADDGVGTTGVDLCGISADCGASAVSATLNQGGGSVCTEEGPGCTTSRSNANAILDDGSACEVDSNPSDFVSLGSDGNIDVTFDRDLKGCGITVVEFAGATAEAWEAYVCDASGENCLNGDEAVHREAAGGTGTFTVPNE